MMSAKGPNSRLTRRSFLKHTAAGISGVAVVVVTGDAAFVSGNTVNESPEGGASRPAYDPAKHRYVYLVDISACIGCGSCVRACERENNVPKNYFRTWVERYNVSRTGNVKIDSPNGGRDGFEPFVTGEDISKAFFVRKL